MKNRIISRSVALFAAVLVVFGMMPLLPAGTGAVYAADDVPSADVTYSADNEWEGTLVIDENKTVKISGITHENTGGSSDGPGPAIRIESGATVNLVFEGANVLSGNPGIIGAGIQVDNSATVNIYGLEGSSLTVTGGKYSAGIGGIGYTTPSTLNPACGNITIHSGNITAIGRGGGAGIGSGYHSSASDIIINGGNITALGRGGGAGIGSGFGTSGGEAMAARVGFYHGGNITISGGTVRAAAWHLNFDDLDLYDTETLYSNDYSNTFAAGIGGGYGASSGNIIIEGNADVTAIGSCGGAGIGTGRGQSSSAKYDENSFNCNVIIRGNSKVAALTTDDRRSNVSGDDGAAAIGLGRGCTLDGSPKGSVRIEGNAEVYAVGSDHAAAIGGSTVVGKYTNNADGSIIRPVNAHLATLTIGSDATVCAVSDGYRAAIDNEPANTISLNTDESYFDKRSDFFTEDKFPIRTEVSDADSGSAKTMFALQSTAVWNVMVHAPNVKKYEFSFKDYKGDDGEKVFISNAIEANSAQFMADPAAVKQYDADDLTARLDKSAEIDTKYGKLKVMVKTAEGVFEYGSTFSAAAADDSKNLDKQYKDQLGDIVYFSIGVKDTQGQKYDSFKGGKVKVCVEIPNGWDKNETTALIVKASEDESLSKTQKQETVNGVSYLTFEADRFGSFALLDPLNPEPGSDHSVTLAKLTAKGSNSLVLSWSKVKDADGYDIFFAKCGTVSSCRKVRTIKGNKTFTWTKKGLKTRTAYKAYVKAWAMKDGRKTYISSSAPVHSLTANGSNKYTNVKSVTVRKTKVSLKTGKTYKIKATINKIDKSKKLLPSTHCRKLRYKSSDPNVATVSRSGKIKAKGAGKCFVYVYAANGASKKIKVTVK